MVIFNSMAMDQYHFYNFLRDEHPEIPGIFWCEQKGFDMGSKTHPQMEKNCENELNEARNHMELFIDLYYIDLC